MKMRKILALVLALVLALSMIACGAAVKEYARGTVASDVYTSEFFCLKYTLPEGWAYATDAEMAEIYGNTYDMMSDDYAAIMEESGTIQEVYAYSATGLETMNIAAENLNVVYSKVLSEEAYIELSVDNLVGALESMGVTITKNEIGTTTLAGGQHACVTIEGEYLGVAIYEKLVAVKEGNYVACIGAASYVENTVDEILSHFEAVK